MSDEDEIYLFAENLVGRSGLAIKPLLFGDKAKYIFGNTRGEELSDREKDLKKSFSDLTNDCYESINLNKVKVVLNFLDDYDVSQLENYEEIDDNDWMAFRVNGEDLFDNKEIRSYWQKRQNEVALSLIHI